MARERVTILDVARAAGVSRQTVTRAMNDAADINPATRERVLAAAEQLGYRPSRFAANMARQKQHSVALVLGTLRNPYYTDLAADLLDAVVERGWQLVLATPERSGDIATVRTLSAQVDVIVGYFGVRQQDLASAARGVPVVLLERRATAPGVHSVEFPFHDALVRALEQLRETGSRRFGMLESGAARGGDGSYAPSRRRCIFEEFVGPRRAGAVVVGEESLTGGGAALRDLLAAHPRIDTVFAFNDLMAMGAIQAAHGLGLDVPGDLRILGVDGLTLGLAVSPTLSTLSVDRRAVAGAVVSLADALLTSDATGPARSLRRTVVPQALWRGST